MKAILSMFLLISMMSGWTSLPESQDNVPKWKQQFEQMKKTQKETDVIQLIEYDSLGVIDSDEAKKSVIERMFADSSYTAIGYLNEVTMRRFGDIPENEMVHFKEIYKHLAIGMKYFHIKWKVKGKIFDSTAIVSDTDGAIWDPIGSMIIISKKETVTNTTKIIRRL